MSKEEGGGCPRCCGMGNCTLADVCGPRPGTAPRIGDAVLTWSAGDDATLAALRAEVARLERRVLAEAAAHDATRHRLACRERELERLRGNFYSGRVADAARIAALEAQLAGTDQLFVKGGEDAGER